jgi:hypothetical protein
MHYAWQLAGPVFAMLSSYLILASSVPTAYAGTCQAIQLTLCSLRTGFQHYYIMLLDYHSAFYALGFQETIKNFNFFLRERTVNCQKRVELLPRQRVLFFSLKLITYFLGYE